MKNLIIDVSRYQNDPNWKVVAKHIDAAIIKATDGSSYVDPKFEKNYRGARAQGLSVMLYHFLRPGDGRQQARKFLKEVNGIRGADKFLTREAVQKGEQGVIGLVVDVEWSPDKSTGDKDTWRHVSVDSILTTLSDFILEAERISGTPVTIYTALTWWEPMTQRPQRHSQFGGVQFADRHLHLADYQPPYPSPYPWEKYSILQKSGNGRVPGISVPVDLNVLREGVTLADLTVRPSQLTVTASAPAAPTPPSTVAKDKDPSLRLERVLYLAPSLLRGADVTAVQEKLAILGKLPANHIDGVWGREMDRITRALQSEAGLSADGKLGPQTLAYLNKLLGSLPKV